MQCSTISWTSCCSNQSTDFVCFALKQVYHTATLKSSGKQVYRIDLKKILVLTKVDTLRQKRPREDKAAVGDRSKMLVRDPNIHAQRKVQQSLCLCFERQGCPVSIGFLGKDELTTEELGALLGRYFRLNPDLMDPGTHQSYNQNSWKNLVVRTVWPVIETSGTWTSADMTYAQ